MMKNLRKSKSGISLIVLVITIIVMIILAAAIILSLSNSGIIGKANKAKTDTDIASAKDIVAMAHADWMLGEVKIKGEDSTITSFGKYAEKKLKEAGYKVGEGTGSYEVTDDGDVYEYPVIPTGFVASDIAGEDTVAGGLVIYEGTEKVSTDSDAQTTRNQFVWVPVPDISEFVREDGYSTNGDKQALVSKEKVQEPSTYEYETGKTLSLENDLTGEWAEYASMKASVEKHRGFYIGRYESGNKSNSAVIVKGITPAVIKWGETETKVESNCAVALSRQMYLSNDSITSTLIYGTQWDAALRFLAKTDSDYLKNNERGWMKSNGSNTQTGQDLVVDDKIINKVCNIYDMAGNAPEWTMEALDRYRVVRGGATELYVFEGNNLTRILKQCNSSYRRATFCTAQREIFTKFSLNYSFRVALYLK